MVVLVCAGEIGIGMGVYHGLLVIGKGDLFMILAINGLNSHSTIGYIYDHTFHYKYPILASTKLPIGISDSFWLFLSNQVYLLPSIILA